MRTMFTQAWLCLIFINSLITNSTTAQINSECFGTTSYQIEKSVRYAISSETSLEEISGYDLLSARGYDNVLTVNQCLGEDGGLSTSTFYQSPANNADGWLPQIYRSEIDGSGARFFGQEDQLLYQSSEDMINALESESIDITIIEDYGFVPRIPEFSLENFDLWEVDVTVADNGSYTLIEEGSEIQFNPGNQSVFTKIFDEGQLVVVQEQYFFEAASGGIVPSHEVIKTYSPLMNGGWMEKSEINTYQSYTINGIIQNTDMSSASLRRNNLGEQNSLSRFDQSIFKENNSMIVFPNPVADKLQLTGDFNIYSVKILNAIGSVIFTQHGNGSRQMELDVSKLPSGAYFVQVCSEAGQSFKQIIKK